MDLGLENKVALVAGGSSGLGLATALELAREGAHVAIGARDPDRLAAAHARLAAVARGRVLATSVDLTDETATRDWVDAVADEFGALHVVLVGGGSPPVGTATGFALADYRAAVDTALLPAVGLALAALPHLRAAGWGRLLFVASETVVSSQPMLSLSGMTRLAVVRFAESLAADVGREGITVNVLAPGATRTPMVERAAARLAAADATETVTEAVTEAVVEAVVEARLGEMGAHTAVGRLGAEDEFAAVATFLASERASFVTGGVYLVDGGAHVSGLAHGYLAAGRRDTFR